MRNIIIILIIVALSFSIKAQVNNSTNLPNNQTDTSNTTFVWSNNTAKTIKKGRKEIGFFGPLKFGLKDSIEIAVHPIFFFIIPNIEMKKYWTSFGIFDLASKHKISYPTLLYKTLSKRGTGGLLPSTSVIPQMFKTNNALVIGTSFNQYLTTTITLGLDLTLSFGKSNFPEIEYHIIYPRTYSLNNVFTPYMGINFTGKFFNNFYYEYNFNAFIMTNNFEGSIFENKLKFQWNISNRIAVNAGLLIAYGEYPYGQDGSLFPIFDLIYGFKE